MFYLFKLFFASFLFFTCNTLFALSNIKSLNLSISKDELAVGDSATLVLEALMDDNETKVIDSDIEWIMNKPALVSINGLTLSTLDEGEVTLQANHKNTLSNALHVNIYKEINGYRLPPEPDPKINNSTILGIDSNGNGVRDDVERKIIDRYKAEPIKIEVQMADVRVFQKILENPIGNAEVLQKKISKNISCEMYLLHQDIDLEEDSIDFIENSTFNTKQRVKAYLQYNQALSGGVYGSSRSDYNAQACDFDVEQMLKDKK